MTVAAAYNLAFNFVMAILMLFTEQRSTLVMGPGTAAGVDHTNLLLQSPTGSTRRALPTADGLSLLIRV